MKFISALVVFCLFVFNAACCIGQDASSDIDFEAGGRFSSPDINNYFALFNAGYNPLNLSEDVQLKGREILKIEVDRFSHSEAKRHELMRVLTEGFDSEQLALFRQYIRLQFYKSDWLRHYPDAEPDVSIKRSFYWLHPELEQVLQVTAQQKQVVLNRSEKFSRLLADQDKRLQIYLKDLLSQWQDRLEDVLLPRQLQQFKSAIGKPFEFDLALNNVFAFAYSSRGVLKIPLCLTKTSSGGEINGGVLPPHLLLIGEQMINGQMDFHAETELLLTNFVREDLELTETQSKRIRELQDRYVKEHPMPTRIRFSFRRRGVSIEPDSAEAASPPSPDKVKNALSGKSEHEDISLELERQLLMLLKEDQRLRWKQIQNQVVLAFGWREVPLSFPDWPSFLELSHEQAEQFELVHVEMETRFAHALEAMWNEHQLERKRIEGLSGEVLTVRQKAQLVLLFGKFTTF